MRILAVTNLYPNPFHPTRATFNRQLLRALAARHDVRVIAPILWTDELSARRRGQPPLPPGRRVVCDGIPVEHPRYLFPPKVLRHWYGHCFRASIRPAFERAVREFRPDLVFTPWAYPDGWAAVEVGHAAGLQVVLKVHGSDVLMLEKYPRRQARTAEALRRADGIVAVSQDLAERVVELGADPRGVEVVYDGIDDSHFHPGPQDVARAELGLPPDGRVVLFVGNLIPVKGLDVLIRACALLRQQGLSFTCVLVGQGPLGAALRQQADRAGLEDCVRFLGALPHDRLPAWYRAADVFVLPSHSEGVPCVLLEAAACGTPFVASRVGGIPEIAHLGPSELTPPGNVEHLAAALRRRLDGPRQDARPPVTIRGWAEVAGQLAGLFEQVLERRRTGRDAAVAPCR
jgi:glycosyltransferase involved in cell wall biosynthesis